MISLQKIKVDPRKDSLKQLSQKELAKQYRQAAYQRAKEFRKTDPAHIAMAEKLKEQRTVAYQKVKERNKAYKAEIKERATAKVSNKKATVRLTKVKKLLVSGSKIKPRSVKTVGL